ncbi:stage II sporulation P family protein [Clostridium sporogenes]|uniref:Stage II sporulation P family protein n=1 Tax=Clostridium sporogenes TaxID=1509 RepID=A0A1L3NJ79_CLOSG|nr:stage II sporulation protein P [Clostridium sporogenes]APH16192.1 stage II sporulation P family protein [Clostridium sporogenes]
MNYKSIKPKTNQSHGKTWIIIFMILIFFVGTVPCVAKAKSKVNFNKRNMLYVQILNYAMPTVKAISFNEEDMAENKFSFKNLVLQMIGLNIHNPISLVEKEMPVLCLNSSKEDTKDKSMALDPFKLEEKEVSKYKAEEMKDGKEDLNLENKVVNVQEPKLKKKLNPKKPEVLIYHTHTTESYKPGEASNFDNDKNVCAVGQELAKELMDNYGINTLHDKTVHDAQAYTQSYARSSVTVDKQLKQHGDFKLIIDLHRDAGSNKKAFVTKLNGENVAKFMMVMAKKNPHFNKNNNMATNIMNTSNKLFPGFCKGIYYYNYGTRYFNQDKSNNAVLIEVGADINTTGESKASAKYLARIIAECLNK